MNLCEGSTVMAKPKGRPRRSERHDISVKIDRAVVARARLVAAFRDVSVAELLTNLVRGPLEREYARMVHEMEKGGE